MIPKPIRSTKTVNRTTSRGERLRGPTSIPRAMPFVVYRIGLATDAFSAIRTAHARFAAMAAPPQSAVSPRRQD